VIQEASLIILRSVDCLRSSEKRSLSDCVFTFTEILGSVYVNTVMHFNIQYLEFWLFNSQVCKFNVQAMEVDSSHALLNILSKLGFADLI